MLLHSIFLGDADKGLEVDLYVVLVLRACIVDKNLYVSDFRKVTADIETEVCVAFVRDPCILSVESDHFMPVVEKYLSESLSYALRCSCYQCSHIFILLSIAMAA